MLLSLCLLAAALGLAPSAASAREGREFEGSFPPGFVRDEGMAVDPASGDLYVIDVSSAGTCFLSVCGVHRFKPDGEPDPFSALGSNVIDGREGADETETPPSGGILSFSAGPKVVQIAVAPPGAAGGTAGNIYVTGNESNLIDVFAPTGEYLGHLNEYEEGPAAEGALKPFGAACGVAVDAAGAVYVSDRDNDQVHKYLPTSNPPANADNVANFSTAAIFPESAPCALAAGAGPTAGFIFVVARFDPSDLAKLDASTGEFKYLLGTGHTTVAVDPNDGHVLGAKGSEVVEYDASGASEATVLKPIEAGSAVEGLAVSPAGAPGGAHAYLARSEAVNVDVYSSPYGPLPPQVEAEWASDVGFTEATLQASFGPEEEETTYHVEYMAEAAFEANGGSFTGPNSPTVLPVPDAAVGTAATVSVELSGLQPDTAYRYRFLATNLAETVVGEPHAFTTLRHVPAPAPDCPNQAFRSEASAFLPDCRAHEMVSPVDKNGGDIIRVSVTPSDPDSYVQAAPDGESITYTSLAGFGDLEAGVNINQYIAGRQERGEPEEGWSSHGILPPVEGHLVTEEPFNGLRQFMGFTPDLCNGWLIDYQTPPMGDGIDGYPNLYRRDNCEPGEGEIETLTDVEPLAGTSDSFIGKNESVAGFSADGSHAFFVAQATLTPEAPEGGGYKLYDRFGGAIHLASVLPGGTPSGGKLGGGSWQNNLAGAVSRDGSRVYWSPGSKLFLRLHPEQGVVGEECSDNATVACTIAVSAGGAHFWNASADGSKAIYTEGKDLYEFDLARQEAEPAKASRLIAKEVEGVAGAAEDLSRVYFVSRAALPESGANSEGDEAEPGTPNLYLQESKGEGEPAYAFVARLSEKDVGQKEPGAERIPYDVVEENPYYRATRVSPDGGAIAFNSRAPLTGYDSTHTPTGRAAVEVFVYEADGELRCASCNPSGGRPQALASLREPYQFPWDDQHSTKTPAAAWLPTWEQPLYASRPLSDSGQRLFFNSYDALLPRDTNGQMDVYEWEAPGEGGCEAGDGDYFAQNGGCIYLISTGESPYESEFWEASADGEDVFFTTESSLVPPDPGSVDLYDARVGGGFSYPKPQVPCEGEACQSPPPPPEFPAPASGTYSGPPNPPAPKGRRCPKGKRKVRRAGKTRCVAKKQGQGSRRAGRRPGGRSD